MVVDNLLVQLDPKALKDVYKDIKQVIKVYSILLREYERGSEDVTKQMNHFKKVTVLLNKKYKGLFFKIIKKPDDFRLGVFLRKEKNLKELFINSVSKIVGIRKIGTKNLGEVDVAQSDAMNKKLDNAKKMLLVSFQNSEHGGQSLILEWNKKQKMVELHYDVDNIILKYEPDFKLFAYHALKEGYDKKIDIYREATLINRPDVPYYKDRKEYLEKFDPRFQE
jgi:hypothetical protein